MLYLGFYAPTEERERYFKEAITRYSDCFYGNGVQVGAFARYGLAMFYRKTGKNAEALVLLKEILRDYPDAINHQGKPLKDDVQNLLSGQSSQADTAVAPRFFKGDAPTDNPQLFALPQDKPNQTAS